jgi:hypothetical protein
MARPQFLHLQENIATSLEARQKFAALARGVLSEFAEMAAGDPGSYRHVARANSRH